MEFDVCLGLRETIGNHLARWNIREFNPSGCNLVANIMMLDVYVLGPGVEDWIVG